jgi:short-subunit dehydrogenase
MANASKRRVFITGASRGIGRAAALALADRGFDLIVTARSERELTAVAVEASSRGVRADPIVVDVTDDASVAAGVARALEGGPIDVLVNNAGVFEQKIFVAQDAAWRHHEMDVNYFGAQRVTRAVLPSMLARGCGTIVNVSSLLGSVPCPASANYSGTKAALDAWSHALRGEVAHRNVNVVVFIPSHTETEQAMRTTRYDGVRAMTVDYTVAQLLVAIEKAPRRYAVSPVFRTFLRLAGLFPAWAERQMQRSTRALIQAAVAERAELK